MAEAELAEAVVAHRKDATLVAHEDREDVARRATHGAHADQRCARQQHWCGLADVVARAQLAAGVADDAAVARQGHRVTEAARDEC